MANASPPIALAKVGRLDLLSQSGHEILVPESVVTEILAGPASDPARLALETGWGNRASVMQIPTALVEWGLGAGETGVLALGIERSPCTVILDDAMARSCARAFQIPVIGTLGVVLRAKKSGLINAAIDVVLSLRKAGLHLDDAVIRMALGKVDETWTL